MDPVHKAPWGYDSSRANRSSFKIASSFELKAIRLGARTSTRLSHPTSRERSSHRDREMRCDKYVDYPKHTSGSSPIKFYWNWTFSLAIGN